MEDYLLCTEENEMNNSGQKATFYKNIYGINILTGFLEKRYFLPS
jgi:hypothetical protein